MTLLYILGSAILFAVIAGPIFDAYWFKEMDDDSV